MLCTPWPSWTVSGCWIVGPSNSSAPGVITATNTVGKEILSYVPLPLVSDFLSKTGQSLIRFQTFLSILTNDLNDLRSASLWAVLGHPTSISFGPMEARSSALGSTKNGSHRNSRERLFQNSKTSQVHILLLRAKSTNFSLWFSSPPALKTRRISS